MLWCFFISFPGSCFCRAGWASDLKPRLTFRNLIAKQRNKKDWEAQVGNDIGNVEVVRWLLKTQFDRDVVTHYDSQELIFDHLFSRLGIDSEGAVHHPVVLTETLCNPNYCRQCKISLFFLIFFLFFSYFFLIFLLKEFKIWQRMHGDVGGWSNFTFYLHICKRNLFPKLPNNPEIIQLLSESWFPNSGFLISPVKYLLFLLNLN